MGLKKAGDYLRRKRLSNNLTITELSKKVGLTPQSISNIETGKYQSEKNVVNILEEIGAEYEIYNNKMSEPDFDEVSMIDFYVIDLDDPEDQFKKIGQYSFPVLKKYESDLIAVRWDMKPALSAIEFSDIVIMKEHALRYLPADSMYLVLSKKHGPLLRRARTKQDDTVELYSDIEEVEAINTTFNDLDAVFRVVWIIKIKNA